MDEDGWFCVDIESRGVDGGWFCVDIGSRGVDAVSYTHLTLPTILRV